MNAQDQAERQLLEQLHQIMNGIAPDGYGSNGQGHVTMADRMEASKRYMLIMERREAEQRRRTEVDRVQDREEDQQAHQQRMDRDSLQAEQTKTLAELNLEHRKLDQEDQRIEIAKAEVIVKALEAAARHPQLEVLTDVVSEMSYRLLGGETLPALEDKQAKEEGE
tara:strand:+ start:105 stop:602 length:498 start_codon:yes stop_codon:yes gene_type:complete